jgi:hypothetical protein
VQNFHYREAVDIKHMQDGEGKTLCLLLHCPQAPCGPRHSAQNTLLLVKVTIDNIHVNRMNRWPEGKLGSTLDGEAFQTFAMFVIAEMLTVFQQRICRYIMNYVHMK